MPYKNGDRQTVPVSFAETSGVSRTLRQIPRPIFGTHDLIGQ